MKLKFRNPEPFNKSISRKPEALTEGIDWGYIYQGPEPKERPGLQIGGVWIKSNELGGG